MSRLRFSNLLLALGAAACGVEQQQAPPDTVVPIIDNTVIPPAIIPPASTAAQPRLVPISGILAPRFAQTTVTRDPLRLPSVPSVINLPSLGNGVLFSTSGSAAIVGSAVAGSASVTGAPVVDVNSCAPPALGAGAFDVTVNGVQYTNPSAASFAYTFTDQGPSGTVNDYLVIGSWFSDFDPVTQAEIASVVYVITPSSDFVVGAQVAFDGVDRLAVFYHGDTSLEPQVAAVAEVGSITFTAGGIVIGDLIDASISGDFVEIQASQPPPPPPPSGPAANIAAGTYNLVYQPQAFAYCDGNLAGQEALFEALLPSDVGLADGIVTIGVAASGLDLAGATGFGASLPLQSDPQAPPGLFFGVVQGSGGSGPLSTNLAAAYFGVDDSSATAAQIQAQAGVAFEDSTGQGFCQIDFVASLTP